VNDVKCEECDANGEVYGAKCEVGGADIATGGTES
jgi:hypothetical protein